MILQPHHPTAVLVGTAADLIQANGLHADDYWAGADDDAAWHPGLALCVAAAIGVAAGHTTCFDVAELVASEDSDRDDIHPAVAAVLDHLGLDTCDELFAWSDAHAENGSARQVVAALRACAAELQEPIAVPA